MVEAKRVARAKKPAKKKNTSQFLQLLTRSLGSEKDRKAVRDIWRKGLSGDDRNATVTALLSLVYEAATADCRVCHGKTTVRRMRTTVTCPRCDGAGTELGIRDALELQVKILESARKMAKDLNPAAWNAPAVAVVVNINPTNPDSGGETLVVG